MEAIASAIQSVALALNPVAPQSAGIGRSSNQSVATAGATLSLGTVAWDNAGMTATANRITITRAGVYEVTADMQYNTVNGTGERQLFIRKTTAGGSSTSYTLDWKAANGSYFMYLSGAKQLSLSVGDYLELVSYHDAGTNLNVTGNLAATRVSL